jgi:hypothetical protein
MLEGLSRFLVEHETHGGGFDVAQPAGIGSGRVSITCHGCGAQHEYATASIEIEREVILEPMPAERDGAAARAGLPAGGRQKEPVPEYVKRRRRVTAGLLVVAVAALAFAIVRLATGGDDRSPVATTTNPALSQKPPPPPPSQPARKVSKTTLVITSAFTLRAPRGWIKDTSQGGLLIHPRGSRSPSLQVFFQRRPALDLGAMAAQTAAFLRGHGATAISSPRRLRVRGDRAFRITARTSSGTTTATGVRHGDTRFLLLDRRGGVKGPAARAMLQARQSFRPR